MSIMSRSYVHAVKKARIDGSSLVFVHSHPKGSSSFSRHDEREEPELFRFAQYRNPQAVHASLVASNSAGRLVGRVWLPDSSTAPIDCIRSIGSRWTFQFLDQSTDEPKEYFRRQVSAFGSKTQHLLSRMHIGIAGAGGTGSAVAEQLVRLGVGRLSVIDHDHFEDSNVNRVYGSNVSDHGLTKVAIAARHSKGIGLGTQVTPIAGHVGFRSVAERLRECDVVFGCTDDQWGRSLLSRISIYYLIPVIDLGIAIDPEGESIRAITGRVTVLQPGYACLYCRGRITAKGVADEVVAFTDPERAAALKAEGYMSGVDAPAPSVVSFTSATASAAVAELLDRLIGYKSAGPKSSEFLYRFEADKLSRNSRPPQPGCFCASRDLSAAGDQKLFLGVSWPQET